MISNTLEMAIHRKNTTRFINADPTEITLLAQGSPTIVNGTKIDNGTAARDPQTFKIIWAGDNGIVRQISDGEGGVRRFNFIILGEFDAEMAIGDTWSNGSQKFVIEYIFPYNGYEVKGGGSSHGESPNA